MKLYPSFWAVPVSTTPFLKTLQSHLNFSCALSFLIQPVITFIFLVFKLFLSIARFHFTIFSRRLSWVSVTKIRSSACSNSRGNPCHGKYPWAYNVISNTKYVQIIIQFDFVSDPSSCQQSFTIIAPQVLSGVVNRVQPSKLFINSHRQLHQHKLWHYAEVEQEAGQFYLEWQYSCLHWF